MSAFLTSVRPELVEGLLSYNQPLARGGQGFDKLSPNGDLDQEFVA